VWRLELAGQVGQEDKRAFKDADDIDLVDVTVVLTDLVGQGFNARLYIVSADQDLS
jgi:hypothetical protein